MEHDAEGLGINLDTHVEHGMDDEEIAAAQEKMMNIMQNTEGSQIDAAWTGLRLGFNLKPMQKSVHCAARNYSKTTKELRTFVGKSIEAAFTALKEMAEDGGTDYCGRFTSANKRRTNQAIEMRNKL